MKFAAVLLAAWMPLAAAQTVVPEVLLPEDFEWFSPPGNSAVQGAWMVGGEGHAGLYLLRVVLAPGARMLPHTHPDTRTTTVLAGTLYVGFGEAFDLTRMVAVPTGAVYVAPAGVPHYLWAKEGEVIYQEAGAGPTKTVPVRR